MSSEPDQSQPKPSALRETRELLSYVAREGRLARTPIYFYIIGVSAGRGLLIYLLNETAAAGRPTWPMALAIFGAIALVLYTSHMTRVTGMKLVEDLALRLRRQIAGQVLNADVSLMQRRDPGAIYNALTLQTNGVAMSSMRLIRLLEALGIVVFVVIYLLWQSWPAGIAAALTLVFGLSAYFLAEIPGRRMARRANAARTAFYDRVNDLIRGYKELRLRRAKRDGLAAHVETASADVRDKMVAAQYFFSLGQTGSMAALLFLLAAIVIGLPLFAGADTVTVLQTLTLVLFAFGPMEGLVNALPQLVQASVAFQNIQALKADLERNAEPASVRHPPAERPSFRRIELRGITAQLHRPSSVPGATAEDSFTLGPIDMVLEPGQSVFITGGNGMGKSTLLQLLTGLRHPDSGEILLDGQPLGRDDIGRYRELFSAVFSEFYLFRTLYGLDAEERVRLNELIEELGLSDGVGVTDNAFTSLALSTGQMRRLALATALAEARPVLVLDEFAADQDPVRRAFFYDVLVPRLSAAGHLVVAVTHDAHCFDRADRVIEMADGRIVADRLQTPRPGLAVGGD